MVTPSPGMAPVRRATGDAVFSKNSNRLFRISGGLAKASRDRATKQRWTFFTSTFMEDQAERRRALESNFQANNSLQWSLRRVEAVPAMEVADKIPGRIGHGEKACFQSHIRAIELAKQSDGHVLIAEDDIAFGSRSFAAIESALALVPEDSWDIIYTEAGITNSHAMIDLLLLRRRGDTPLRLINLAPPALCRGDRLYRQPEIQG